MPSWQPNWNNVRWDFAAAEEARSALRRAADILDESAHERNRRAKEAAAEWHGRYRNEFDVSLDKILVEARNLAEKYRHMASQIARASQQAYEEQQYREAQRGRWQREKEMEEWERRRR